MDQILEAESLSESRISIRNQVDPPDAANEIASEAANDEIRRLVRAQFSPAHHVLEIGCGNGWLGEFILTQGVRRYEGIDTSANAVKTAQDRLSRFGNAKVQRGEALDPECYFRPFDFILAHRFLPFLIGKDRQTWLKICRSTLFRSRGRLIISSSVGIPPQMKESIDPTTRIHAASGQYFAENREIQLELLNCGFEITDVRYPAENSALYIARAL